MRIITIFFALLVLFSCRKDNNNAPYEGTWVYDRYEDEAFVYEKAARLDDNKAGYIFKQNGELVRRENIGWCGTPPVTYTNYEGTWTDNGNNMLDISSTDWSGTVQYKMEIISLTGHTMRVKNKY